jgi:hypothetical protein
VGNTNTSQLDYNPHSRMDVVPGDRSASARTVAATFGVLAWIAVSLRCFVRLHIIKRFGWDDGLMVAALVSTLSFDFLPRSI